MVVNCLLIISLCSQINALIGMFNLFDLSYHNSVPIGYLYIPGNILIDVSQSQSELCVIWDSAVFTIEY